VVSRYAGTVIREALIHTIGIRVVFIYGLANTWNSGTGVGQLCNYSGGSVVRGFLRGGSWSNGGYAGVLTLNLYGVPSSPYANVGFRVSR
jgi:hypothetical protein